MCTPGNLLVKEKPLKRRGRGAPKKLNKTQVWEARRRAKSGEHLKILAEDYQVSYPTLCAAVYGFGTYEAI